MDYIGILLVIISFTSSAIAAYISFKTYRTLGTRSYEYLTWSLICFTILPLGYLFLNIFQDPIYRDVAFFGSLSFNVFAYVGLAGIIAAIEYLKPRPNEFLVNLSFIFAGILVAGRFLPSFQEFTWNGTSWEMMFKAPLMNSFVIFYIYVLVMVIPFLFRLWRLIRTRRIFDFKARTLFIAMIVSLCYSVIVLILTRGEVQSELNFALHGQGYLIFVSVGTLFIANMFRVSPTILFASTNDILFLGIVRTRDHQPIFEYNFEKSNPDYQAFLVTGVHSSINVLLQDVINSGEDLKQIGTGQDVVTVATGKRVTGFVITRTEIEVLGKLVPHILNQFEYQFSGHEILSRSAFPEFSTTVENIFQFAIAKRG